MARSQSSEPVFCESFRAASINSSSSKPFPQKKSGFFNVPAASVLPLVPLAACLRNCGRGAPSFDEPMKAGNQQHAARSASNRETCRKAMATNKWADTKQILSLKWNDGHYFKNLRESSKSKQVPCLQGSVSSFHRLVATYLKMDLDSLLANVGIKPPPACLKYLGISRWLPIVSSNFSQQVLVAMQCSTPGAKGCVSLHGIPGELLLQGVARLLSASGWAENWGRGYPLVN